MAFLEAKEEVNNNINNTPEAAEVTVLCQGWLMISESCLPTPGRAVPGEGQPQAAHMGELLESCLPTLGCAALGKSQPEAAQYLCGLRMASEESCLPLGCAAWRRSRLLGTSGEMDDRKFYIYDMRPLLKAKDEGNNNVRMPSDELCMPEAAVLCQAWLMVASESCLPPGHAALGEAQCQGGLRMAAEKVCMLLPRNAGGGQPEAAQYQGGLRTALEALGLDVEERSRRTSVGTVGSNKTTNQVRLQALAGGRCQVLLPLSQDQSQE
jgi:hypothetical protein